MRKVIAFTLWRSIFLKGIYIWYPIEIEISSESQIWATYLTVDFLVATLNKWKESGELMIIL